MTDRRAMTLSLRTPLGTLLDRPVWRITAEDSTGRFGVRPGMEELVAVLVPGLLEVTPVDGPTLYVAVGPGLLHARPPRVDVAARDAVVCASPEGVYEALDAEAESRERRSAALTGLFRDLQRSLLEALLETERLR